jgi:hypothetical protein
MDNLNGYGLAGDVPRESAFGRSRRLLVSYPEEEIERHRSWRTGMGRSLVESSDRLDRLRGPVWLLVGSCWERLGRGESYEQVIVELRSGWLVYFGSLSPGDQDLIGGPDAVADFIEDGLDSWLFKAQRRSEREAAEAAQRQAIQQDRRLQRERNEPVPAGMEEMRRGFHRAIESVQAREAERNRHRAATWDRVRSQLTVELIKTSRSEELVKAFDRLLDLAARCLPTVAEPWRDASPTSASHPPQDAVEDLGQLVRPRRATRS